MDISRNWSGLPSESGDLSHTSLQFPRNYAIGITSNTGRNPSSGSTERAMVLFSCMSVHPLGQRYTWVATTAKVEIGLKYPDLRLRAAQHRHHLNE